MRKNTKKSQRASVLAMRVTSFAGLLVLLCTVLLVYRLAESKCTQLRNRIGERTRELNRLEEDRVRAEAHWYTMLKTDNMEKTMLRHGLSMKYPAPAQIIYVDRNGNLTGGRVAVEQARRRVTAFFKAR